MTDQKTELEELKALQKESQMLREKREETGVEAHAVPEVENACDPDEDVQEESADTVSQDGGTEGLTGQVETLMAELEEAAAEHPGLALLAAFGIGIFVGQLLSRR